MEFPERKKREMKLQIEKEKKLSICDLTFFFEAPDCSVSLQEFEDYAVARLKLLRILERVSLTSATMDTNEWREKVENELGQCDLVEFQFLMTSRDEDELERARKFDHVSHYILRLAFSRTEELRRWFVNQEVEFFRYKFACSADGNLAKNILEKQFQDTIKKFEGKKDDKLILDLQDTYYYINSVDVSKGDIYEVPFTQCLDLVKSRRVFLKNGKAYIFHPQLLTIVCSEFRRLLSKDLAATSKIMSIIDEDERLAQILTDFDKRHTGSSYVVKNGSKELMTVEKLEQTSAASFPLCMKSLYDTVKKDYHLRHFGRLQLGLFFKGLGLPMDEATRYWRTNFTKKPGVDVGRFDKQYLYNIRHMYGQEGKRADYTPYSCMKIIMSSVGPGESHGCPFRHSDGTSLRVKLAEANIPTTGVKEIVELVEKQHYQIACQRYFEWTHAKATVEGGVNHPNQYFEESQKVLSGLYKVKTEASKPSTTRSNMYPKQESNTNPDDFPEAMDVDDDDILSYLQESPQKTPAMKEADETLPEIIATDPQ